MNKKLHVSKQLFPQWHQKSHCVGKGLDFTLYYFIFQATTDVGDGCTTTFQGTSASCPIAAGIIALVLEAK